MKTTPDAPEQGAPAVAEEADVQNPEGQDDAGQEQPKRETHEDRMARLRAELGADEGDDTDDEDFDGEGEEAEAAAGDMDEGEAGDDSELVMLTFPGRSEDDEPFELPVTKAWLEEQGISEQDVVERNRQLNNGYNRTQALRAEREELQAEKDEVDMIVAGLRDDPVGFLSGHVDPAIRTQVAQDLILELDDEGFRKLTAQIDRWSRDPQGRKAQRLETENKRLKEQDTREETHERTTAVKKNVEAIGTAITDLIPEGMDEGKAQRFFRIAVAEIQRHARENKLDVLEPATVPELLASVGVLEDYGLSSDGSATAGSPRTNGTSSAADKAADKKGPKGQGDARTRMARRKNAVATPAGSASSAAEGFRKVKGERHLNRRNRLAKALGLPEKKEM